MGKVTKIEWADSTWGPVSGCDKVSPGCDNCYADAIATRFAGGPAYPNGFALTLKPEKLFEPLKWKKPRRVFVNSMSDVFHAGVPDDYVWKMFAVMATASQHEFLILTKRPQRMKNLLTAEDAEQQLWAARQWLAKERPKTFSGPIPRVRLPLSNVWLGVSVESAPFRFRLDFLRKTPAAVRFVSLEPLIDSIGPVPSDHPGTLPLGGIDWAIIGGESGPGSRPMDLAWVRYILKQCSLSETAVFVKQLGSVWAKQNGAKHPKGGDPAEWPEWLRRREFPTVREVAHA